MKNRIPLVIIYILFFTLSQQIQASSTSSITLSESLNSYDQTQMILAIELGEETLIHKILINKNVDLNFKSTDSGWTPLMYAAYYNQANIALLLLSKGSDIHIKNADGLDALEIAKIMYCKSTVLAMDEFLNPQKYRRVPEPVKLQKSNILKPQGSGVNPMLANNTSMTELKEIVKYVSAEQGVSPTLIYAIMRSESSFNTRAISPKGAGGLMQLMPATAARFGVFDVFDPEQNIRGAVKYLNFLTKRFNGNLTLAIAAYNAGEGAVDKYNGIPNYPETIAYVDKVCGLIPAYNSLLGENSPICY